MWLAGLLIVVGAWSALGNVPPTMEDQYVTAVQDSPVTFEMVATDEDIKPLNPEGHLLRFVLLDGPNHGLLIGDMEKVLYEGPHNAVVELTYVPATGFVGIDRVTITVFDPFDEKASGTITIQIDVAARRAEGLLSGSWATNMTWESQSGSFSAFATQLRGVYSIGALTMKGMAQLRKASGGGVGGVIFDSLRFDGDIKLRTLSLASTLTFDPNAAVADVFDYWRTTVAFTMQDVRLRYTFYLADPVTSSYQTLIAQATAGKLSFTNTLRLGGGEDCGFGFARDDVTVAWNWCDFNMRATVALSCAGFDQATLSMSGLPISGFLPGITLNSKLTFTTDAKTLSTTLQWRPLRSGCIRVYSELEVGGAHGVEIEGFSIYGVKLEFDISGVKVVSATALDSAKNSRVTGKTDYFEVLRMSGPLASCCGAPGTWSLATYFNEDSLMLFDWGMSVIRATAVISDHFNFSFETVFRSGFFGDPKLELSVGWTTRW